MAKIRFGKVDSQQSVFGGAGVNSQPRQQIGEVDFSIKGIKDKADNVCCCYVSYCYQPKKS